MSNIAIMDNEGIINSGYEDICQAIEDIPNVREENEIVGEIKVIEILHIDD